MLLVYDIAVIGGGPSGLTAAIYAQRAGKKCAVFEKNITGGMINDSAKVENIPGFTTISGADFAVQLTEQCETQGAEIVYEEVTSVVYLEPINKFIVSTDCEEYEVKSVIIATGTKHNVLGLPDEDKLIGNGVHFCALCDGAFYKDEDVVVVGGGNSALTEALYLSSICKTVTILQNLSKLTGDKILIDRISNTDNINVITNCNIKSYCIYENKLVGINYTTEQDQPFCTLVLCRGVFLCIGLSPNKDITCGLLKYNERGYIVDSEVTGLYYCGDCSNDTKVKQVVTACSSGAVAATSACSYIDSLN